MPYTIGEVARMMNIAPSTLRYYEKEGLLSLGVRASNGQRTYTDDDIATLSIIEYLKFCGLPLKEIRSFLPLIRPGGETLSARRDILAKERDNVRAQITALQTKLERLEFGCWFYETAQQYGSVLPLYEFSEEHFPPELWGDRIFEKCGIGRDEGGDGGKTLEIRGKRRLSARDGGANYQQS